MGAFSVTNQDPGWVNELVREYAAIIGEDVPAANGPTTFAVARDACHGAAKPPPPERLDIRECRMEWRSHRIDGSVSPVGRVGQFVPDCPADETPQVGAQVRLRHADGVMKAVVVGHCGSDVLLMRAPTQRERRAHQRIGVAGVALVRFNRSNQEARISDLSEGGIGLSSPMAVEVGGSIHLLLRIHGKKALPLECDGIVTSCRAVERGPQGEHRIGVKFVDLSPKLVDRIRLLLHDECS